MIGKLRAHPVSCEPMTSLIRGGGARARWHFFLISKNVVHTNGYSMHQKHRANPKNTRRRKQEKKHIRKPSNRLITKRRF